MYPVLLSQQVGNILHNDKFRLHLNGNLREAADQCISGIRATMVLLAVRRESLTGSTADKNQFISRIQVEVRLDGVHILFSQIYIIRSVTIVAFVGINCMLVYIDSAGPAEFASEICHAVETIRHATGSTEEVNKIVLLVGYLSRNFRVVDLLQHSFRAVFWLFVSLYFCFCCVSRHGHVWSSTLDIFSALNPRIVWFFSSSRNGPLASKFNGAFQTTFCAERLNAARGYFPELSCFLYSHVLHLMLLPF